MTNFTVWFQVICWSSFEIKLVLMWKSHFYIWSSQFKGQRGQQTATWAHRSWEEWPKLSWSEVCMSVEPSRPPPKPPPPHTHFLLLCVILGLRISGLLSETVSSVWWRVVSCRTPPRRSWNHPSTGNASHRGRDFRWWHPPPTHKYSKSLKDSFLISSAVCLPVDNTSMGNLELGSGNIEGSAGGLNQFRIVSITQVTQNCLV